jgi:hypothetical protein
MFNNLVNVAQSDNLTSEELQAFYRLQVENLMHLIGKVREDVSINFLKVFDLNKEDLVRVAP